MYSIYTMAKKRQSRRKPTRRYRGGEGASDYAQKVFGGMEQQQAQPGYGNAISMSAQSGGKQQQQQQQQQEQQQKQQQQQAGNVLTDIAVPAVLITANHLYRGKQVPINFVKSRKFRKSRNSRRSRRFRRR
jgi:hypothetical protein